jgi:hypothetical protein
MMKTKEIEMTQLEFKMSQIRTDIADLECLYKTSIDNKHHDLAETCLDRASVLWNELIVLNCDRVLEIDPWSANPEAYAIS